MQDTVADLVNIKSTEKSGKEIFATRPWFTAFRRRINDDLSPCVMIFEFSPSDRRVFVKPARQSTRPFAPEV